MKYKSNSTLAICILATGAAIAASADDIKLEWLPSGVTKKVGGYRPMRMELSPEKPAGITKAPADLSAPLYGKLTVGPTNASTTVFVILDEPEGKMARLYIDSNGNGDLTDDPSPEWTVHEQKKADGGTNIMYTGGGDVAISYDGAKLPGRISMYRFDKHDPERAELKNTLLYYRDFGRGGDLTLGDKPFHAILLDDAGTGDFQPTTNGPSVHLLLDLNNDGKFQREEAFDVMKPFNIGGTTWEVAGLTSSGASFHFVKSTNTVPETKPRPLLAAGVKALPFEAKTTDGETVNFPDKYKGKLVLLDFWATWCGPCKEELPNVISAYEKYHTNGFEILSVSLDRPNDGDKLAKFTKEHNMPWPEIYDGQDGKAVVAHTYYVDYIPQAYLVDGDSGMIVGAGESIQGEALAPAIEKALAKHQ